MKCKFFFLASLCFWALLPGGVFAGTRTLGMSENLQSAVNNTHGGDTLVLPDGYSWTGHLVLPVRADQDWVTIKSMLPLVPGERVKPGEPKARIISPDEGPAIANDYENPDHGKRPSHGWRFVGVEITVTTTKTNWNAVLIGFGKDPRLSDAPYNFEFERCYIHGDGVHNHVRGIMGNAANITVKDSWLGGFTSTYMEANTINVYSSAGPIVIVNNYLEATGENVMIGGSGPDFPSLIPTRITISHNYFFKPLKWRGSPNIVKNLLEFKDGTNAVISNNVFENSWAANQTGAAILFTPRTGGGTAKNTVGNIVFTDNIVRHATTGVVVALLDDGSQFPREQLTLAKDFTFRNNFFEDLSGPKWGQKGFGMLLFGPPENLVVDRNTFEFGDKLNATNFEVNHGWWLVGETGNKPSNAVVTRNVFGWQMGGDGRNGPDALLPGGRFEHNVVQNVAPFWLAAWKEKSPGTAINVAETAPNVGARVKELLAGEADIKSGHMPQSTSGSPIKTIPRSSGE